MTRRGISFLVSFALLLLAGLATGYREIFLAVFSFGLLLLTALLSSLLGAVLLRCRQTLASTAVVREEAAALQLDFSGVAVLPVLAAISARLPEREPPRKGDRRLLLARCAIRPGIRGKQVRLDIDCPHRGVWQLGLDKLRIQDIFGFFSLPLFFCRELGRERLKLTVYPAVVELAGEPAPPVISNEYNESSFITADHGESFAGTRQYRDGDSLKRIHWIQSIRTRELYTRQYEVATEQLTLLLLDTGLPSGANPAGCADMMTECATSLGYYYVIHGQPVQLLCPRAEMESIVRYPEEFPAMHTLLAELDFGAVPGFFELDAPAVRTMSSIRSLHVITYRLSHELLEALRPLTAKRIPVTCIVPPDGALQELRQHALDIDVRLVPIFGPEDIAARLGDCL